MADLRYCSGYATFPTSSVPPSVRRLTPPILYQVDRFPSYTPKVPPFRGEKRTEPRGVFLHFRSIDDARAGLRALDGRQGPGGETLHVTLSRMSAVHPNRLWRWAYMEEGGEEESYLHDECAGLGFGTGAAEQQEGQETETGTEVEMEMDKSIRVEGHGRPVGTRGGHRGVWKDPAVAKMRAREKMREEAEDLLLSYPLWTPADSGESDPRSLRAGAEAEAEAEGKGQVEKPEEGRPVGDSGDSEQHVASSSAAPTMTTTTKTRDS